MALTESCWPSPKPSGSSCDDSAAHRALVDKLACAQRVIEAADSPAPEPRNCSNAGPKSPEDSP
jgi:hypothetical protein